MANIRIGYSNLWSAAASVITASTAATGLPAAASQNPDRSYPWRSTTLTTAHTLDIDLGSAQSPTMAAIVSPKLVGSGVVELYQRGSAGAPGAATLVATFGAVDTDTRVAAVFFAATSARHWQLTFTNPTVASDYAELGYAFLGTYIEPTINPNAPMGSPLDDPSVGTSSVDGQLTFTQRSRFASLDLQFDMLPVANLTEMKTLYRTVGKSVPFILALIPDDSTRIYFGRFTSAFNQSDTVDPTRFDLQLGFAEAR